MSLEKFPQRRSADTRHDAVGAGSMHYDRQELAEVTGTHHSDSSKWLVLLPNVSQTPVHGFQILSIGHGDLVPDNKPNSTKHFSLLGLRADSADILVGSEQPDWDLEPRVKLS